MLEVCIASALLAMAASSSLGATLLAQREASLAALRQNAVALANEQLEWAAAAGNDAATAAWQGRVASALPGGEGGVVASAGSVEVTVRWRVPGVSDTRCPGATCVVLGSGS